LNPASLLQSRRLTASHEQTLSHRTLPHQYSAFSVFQDAPASPIFFLLFQPQDTVKRNIFLLYPQAQRLVLWAVAANLSVSIDSPLLVLQACEEHTRYKGTSPLHSIIQALLATAGRSAAV
jgi:hypothetical protein